jgi:16S rRNA pseudouridine516 synthase
MALQRKESMSLRDQMLNYKKAVLFDMDGTLCDSMWVWFRIDEDFFRERGEKVPDDLQAQLEGLSFTETAQYFQNHFCPERSIQEIKDDWNRQAREKYQKEVTLKPGAYDFLVWLKNHGYGTAVCTSNSRELVDAFLESHNIRHLFDYVVTACEVNAGKPAPDIYLQAAKELQTPPDQCIVFEDVPAGLLAGIRAGMETCAVEDAYSHYCREEKQRMADYYLNSYCELIEE